MYFKLLAILKYLYYVKYGNVAQIATYSELAPRQALQYVGRVESVAFYETNQMTSLDICPLLRGTGKSISI
jgi:DNA polymerase III alpha subunit